MIHARSLTAAATLSVAVLVSAVSACSKSPGSGARRNASPAIRSVKASPAVIPALPPAAPVRWSSCGGGFQCGTVAVPEDYTTARSSRLSLSVTRRPASHPAPRAGVLVVDFGGPAISGTATLRVAAALLPARVLDRFDVVSFDPRGSGKSRALQCAPGSPAAGNAVSAQLLGAAVGAAPVAAAGQPLPVAAVYRRLYMACHNADGALLATITSSVQARDLDRVRTALGVRQLRYLGVSYGSVLGLAYAQRFPQRVAAMLLDSPVDPTEPIGELAQQQAAAAEQALQQAFGDRLGRAAAIKFDVVAGRLRRAALPAPAGGDTTAVSLGDLQLATLTYLQMPALAPQFPAALTSALAGDGKALRTLAASQYQDVDGTPDIGAYWATLCGDTPERPSPVAANTASRTQAGRYPLLGAVAYAFAGGACTVWPPATEPIKLPRGQLPIAIVGGTGDPIAPYAAAQGLVRELPGSVLITRVGEGHTALTNAVGDTCLANAESRFLLNPAAVTSPLRCTDPPQK